MSMNIKAIETTYNGIRFRSRLEARWAVFMDSLCVDWEYEPEGFTNGDICYLPDFWLPKLECYLEIKPSDPTEEEILKIQMLVTGTDKSLFVLVGQPSDFNMRGLGIRFDMMPDENGMNNFVRDDFHYWASCDKCGAVGITFNGNNKYLSCGKHDRGLGTSVTRAIQEARNRRFGAIA